MARCSVCREEQFASSPSSSNNNNSSRRRTDSDLSPKANRISVGILRCFECGISSHPNCCGEVVPHSDRVRVRGDDEWLCSICRFKRWIDVESESESRSRSKSKSKSVRCRRSRSRLRIQCVLCGHGQDDELGPLVQTECGRWAHPFCVCSNGGDGMRMRIGFRASIHRQIESPMMSRNAVREERACSICNSVTGATIKCVDAQCTVYVHPLCAALSDAFKSMICHFDGDRAPKLMVFCNEHRHLTPLKMDKLNDSKMAEFQISEFPSTKIEIAPTVGLEAAAMAMSDSESMSMSMEETAILNDDEIADNDDVDGDGERISLSLDDKLCRVQFRCDFSRRLTVHLIVTVYCTLSALCSTTSLSTKTRSSSCYGIEPINFMAESPWNSISESLRIIISRTKCLEHRFRERS